MEKLNSEDGQLFVKNLASFVRTHEKALANALQLRRQSPKSPSSSQASSSLSSQTSGHSSTSSTFAAALSFGALKFTSHNVKPAKLTLTPHHLFYLLSRFEELSIPVGPMNVRLESIHTETSAAYVSFLSKPQRPSADRESIHSVSSVRSVMSGMSGLWSTLGIGSKDSLKSDKAKAAVETDLKYLYSAFTKIPCLRLAPDHRARLIRGYEEFPFDTAVPLHSFKNLSALEIIDIDFRSFFGWDRVSEQLRTLTLKRAKVDDPADLLTSIVLDDVDKRRRRASRSQPSPVLGCNGSSHPQTVSKADLNKSNSAPGSPGSDHHFATSASPKSAAMIRAGSEGGKTHRRNGSNSPTRPVSSKQSSHRHSRGSPIKVARSGSGSSNSSETSITYHSRSYSNLLAGVLPPSKWRFLRHLGLPDNALTYITAHSLAPVANTLQSLDLSTNLFTEVPDSLATLVYLRALNLSNCMIDSLRSLSKSPLPAITALNLRGNRLSSLAGIERLLSLERLDLRDNNLSDPAELARLTGLPEIREIWVSGNPFTRTHSSYRVTIFNLFRRTPGYSDDVIIDGCGPGYSERKQLVDRAAEPEAAPVVRRGEPEQGRIASPVPVSVVQTLPRSDSGSSDAAHARQDPPLTQDNQTVGSNRRKKGQRRRIVDLSREESMSGKDVNGASTQKGVVEQMQGPSEAQGGSSLEETCSKTSLRASHQESLIDSARATTTSEAASPKSKQYELVPAIQDLDLDMDGIAYRRRLEALKQDVGNGWLSALGEAGWNSNKSMNVVPRSGPGFQSPPIVRTGSQIMVSGGRTLG